MTVFARCEFRESVLLALTAMLWLDFGARADITGVATVIDGDTLEIHGQRIQLHAIDAPESSQTCLVDAGQS